MSLTDRLIYLEGMNTKAGRRRTVPLNEDQEFALWEMYAICAATFRHFRTTTKLKWRRHHKGGKRSGGDRGEDE